MYWIDNLPSDFQPVLQRIEVLFDADVWIDDFDDEWVNFYIPGMIDRCVIEQLELNKTRILPGADRQRFQILCTSEAGADEGLWLHYLADAGARMEFRSGMWFY